MTTDDDIPEHDPLSQATRRALGRLGDTPALDELSWGAVQSRARRVKAQRISALVAACAIVVVGLGAVVANAKGSGDHVSVAGTVTTTASSTTTTVLPTTTTAPTTPVPPPDVTAPITAPQSTTPITTPAGDQVVQPQDGSWVISVTTNRTTVQAGDDFVINVKLSNTGTHLQSTDGYGSFAVACGWFPKSPSDVGPSTLPIGAFLEGAILRPGETQTFSQTFTADPSFVGLLRCGASVVLHGDAQSADTTNGTDVLVDPAADTAPTTTTVPTESTTTTTAP